MIVTPYREDPFLSPRYVQSFDEFLTIVRAELNGAIHAKAVTVRAVGVDNPQQFLSLSMPLDDVDPLEALRAIAHTPQPHPQAQQHPSVSPYFYWENGRTGEAIAAIGCAQTVEISGHQRFPSSKQAVQDLFERTLPIGNRNAPFSGPRVFCRFTFFDRVASLSPFSPATLILPQWQIATDGTTGSFVANAPLPTQHTLRETCLAIWETLSRLHQMPSARPPRIRPSHNRPGECPGYPPSRQPCGRQATPSNLITRSFGTPRPRCSTVGSQSESSHSRKNPGHCSALVLPQLPQAAQRQVVETVTSVLHTLETTDLNKVVLAHALDVHLDGPFNGRRDILSVDALSSLYTLRQCHSDCYLFATQNDQGQTFLCASPEKLVSTQGGDLATEAIAGSAPRGSTPAEDARYAHALLNNRKERYEHQLVVDFISQQLAALGLETKRSPVPSLLPLSTIQHLQTPIIGTMPTHLHPLDLVAALHPTPAVAGVPRDMACALIQQHESFERSLYAAPMGWIDAQGDSEFLVGIRSALLDRDTVRLYAGAGIVQGSNPQQELAEIELKLRSLYSTLIQPG